ncbi:hypothetical protein SD81_009950 [Tolypothrix campylonemoides VB511288]|nr:hypothetical protein SD81_009950 [Tolypothrix campylonemoides VB511288]
MIEEPEVDSSAGELDRGRLETTLAGVEVGDVVALRGEFGTEKRINNTPQIITLKEAIVAMATNLTTYGNLLKIVIINLFGN